MIVVAASTVGVRSTAGVKVGDGIETSVATGVFVIAGAIVEVGAEAMPQSCPSNSPFEAEYRDDSVEKFYDSSGCLIVPSGQE